MEESRKTIPIEEILSTGLLEKIDDHIDRFIAGLNLANRKEIIYKISLGQIEIAADTLVINDDKLKLFIIKKIVCEYYGVSFDHIKLHTKKRIIVEKRQILQYFLSVYTTLILSEIGSETGGFDHATVLHAKKVVNNRIDTNKPFRNEARKIKLLILDALIPE